MTQEELRALDAEIHRKIMTPERECWEHNGEWWEIVGICRDMTGACLPTMIPNYSTDIAAAMQVAEKLSEMNHTLVLEDWRSDRQRWCALFRLADGHDTGQFIDDTAALAITLAALKAVNAVR